VNRALKDTANSSTDIAVRLPSPFLTRTVNTLFAIESDLRNNWSKAHREAIKLVRHGRTQVEMAELLGVTQAAISQRLKHARWDRYLEVCAVIDEFLTQARWKMLLPWDLKKEQKNKEASKRS
jgi:DNA-binding XRE family transcriptional regulator